MSERLKRYRKTPQRSIDLSAGRRTRLRGSSHLHGLHRPGNPKYVHDSLEVIGQHLKAHLGTYSPERPGQEVCGTHPVFERIEDMLNGTSADGHRIGLPVKPALHRFQRVLVLPSSDPAIVAR